MITDASDMAEAETKYPKKWFQVQSGIMIWDTKTKVGVLASRTPNSRGKRKKNTEKKLKFGSRQKKMSNKNWPKVAGGKFFETCGKFELGSSQVWPSVDIRTVGGGEFSRVPPHPPMSPLLTNFLVPNFPNYGAKIEMAEYNTYPAAS